MFRNLLLSLAVFSTSLCAQQRGDFSPKMKPLDLNIADAKRAHYEKFGYIVLGESVKDDTLRKGNFVATRTVTIPKDAHVALLTGANVLFEPGVRLVVEGMLSAQGPCQLRDVPIDNLYDKTSSTEWGGIAVGPEGSLALSNVGISSCARGVMVSDTCRMLNLNDVSFAYINGPWVSVRGNETERMNPVSLRYPSAGLQPRHDSVAVGPVKKKGRAARPLRIVSVGTAIAGAGVAAFGIYRYAHNLGLLDSSKDPAKHTTDEVVKYQQDAKNGRIMAIVGGAVAVVGVAGFMVTFAF